MAATVESGLLILALAILLGPALVERLRIPGMVGLIAAGMVLGPFVLGWLQRGGLVATVGAVGLLYLMFLAGLELDLKSFAENRRVAAAFGLLTFAIPFALSWVVGDLVLGLGAAGAALMGAMWASHTLVAYPEVKTAGLDRTPEVGSTVAATVITDVLALVILAVAASTPSLEADPTVRTAHAPAPLPLWLGLILLAVFTLWLLPRLTRWLFVHVGHTRAQRFVIVLAGMSGGALIALLGGIEGLVGAFLAGIGVNRLIPARSGLMEHVEFVGSALLVPAFLVAVGLSIDPAALVEPATIRLATIFVAVVMVGKTAAAILCGALFRLPVAAVGLMTSLTVGQAAATLAIAQVGTATGIFDQDVFNAAILTVVVMVFVTSFGTRFFARRIDRAAQDHTSLGSHVLVHAPGAEQVRGLVGLALDVARDDDGLVTPFAIGGTAAVDDSGIAAAIADAVRLGADCDGVTRIDASLASGATNLAVERHASLLILPWEGPRLRVGLLFGSHLDTLGATSPVPVAAVSMRTAPWRRVVVVTGSFVDDPARHDDVRLALELALRVCRARELGLVVHAPAGGGELALPRANGLPVEIRHYLEGSGAVLAEIGADDLVVLPTHVVAMARRLHPWRVVRAAESASVVVVAGPGRLNLSGTSPRRPGLGVVAGRSAATAGREHT